MLAQHAAILLKVVYLSFAFRDSCRLNTYYMPNELCSLTALSKIDEI